MDDPSYNIAGCVLKYSDYKSAAVYWKRACKSAESAEDFEQLCQSVANALASSFEDGAYDDLLKVMSAAGFDFENDLRPIVDPLNAQKAVLEQKRRREKEERERRQKEEEARRLARAEELRVQRRILEEKRRKLEKEMSDFLKQVKASAVEGVFNLIVPDHLASVIDRAYERALIAGGRVYLKGIIYNGDLRNYDLASGAVPHCLRELSKQIKAQYVADAIERATDIRLDGEQLEAVLADDHVMKVTARAGSGKTRVLVAKAFYLIKFYNLNPDSILLLAFNRNAAREIQERLKSLLALDTFHTARTFHSLAYQIAKPDSELVMSDVDPAIDKVGGIIQRILRGIWKGEVAESIYTFFRSEAREYEGLGLHLKGDKFYKFRRSLPQATLRGDAVRSSGEKYIADYLFEHGIGYKYEPAFRMKSEGVYRPDFYFWQGEGPSKRKFAWEHWAFDPRASSPQRIDGWSAQEIKQYRKDIDRKRLYWSEKGWPLIETHAGMLSNGRACFESQLRGILNEHGIENGKLPQAELLERVEVNLRSRLSKLLSQFVSRSLSSECDTEVLLARIDQYTPKDDREKSFLKLGVDVLQQYLSHLEENKLMDYSLVFAEARRVLGEMEAIPLVHASGGHMIDLNSLNYIFVDEAQDMSPNYLLLLQSLKSLLPNVKMMFVGDDWQAINRFAGADVNLFINLNERYGETSGYSLKSNYRSCKEIVHAGNLLMGGNSVENAKATKLEAAQILSTDIHSVWLELRKDDEHQAARRSDQKFLWGANDFSEEKAKLVKAVFNICKPMLSGTAKISVLINSKARL